MRGFSMVHTFKWIKIRTMGLLKIIGKIAKSKVGKAVSKVTNTGLVKPAAGTGIGKEASQVIATWQEGKKLKAILRGSAYLIGVLVVWYLIGKGYSTLEIKEFFDLVSTFAEFIV
jgi:hypothetical protein